MISGWKRFVQTVLGQPNQRRFESRPLRAAEIETLEGRTVLSVSTLAVNNDTYLTNHSGQDQAANLGGLNELRIYKDTAEVYRTILEADLGSLPSGATINSATLQLYHTPAHSFGTDSMTVTLYALTHAWVEGTGVLDSEPGNGASWLNAAPGVAWATPGGDLGAAITTVVLPAANSAGWVQFDITSAVKAWQSGAANYGLAIVVTSGGLYTQYSFASSEAAETSLRPQLVVDATDPVTPPTPHDHRSPVAVFILSQVPGGSDVRGRESTWTAKTGQEKSKIAHQLRDIDHGHHSAAPHDDSDDLTLPPLGLPGLGL